MNNKQELKNIIKEKLIVVSEKLQAKRKQQLQTQKDNAVIAVPELLKKLGLNIDQMAVDVCENMYESVKHLSTSDVAAKVEAQTTELLTKLSDFSSKQEELNGILKGGIDVKNFHEFPKSFEVTKIEKPEWYKEAPEEVSIKGPVEIKADNSGIAAIASAFLSSLVDFFSQLSNKIFNISLGADHYTTPQTMVLYDPVKKKYIDLAEAFKTVVIGGSNGGAYSSLTADALENYKISDGDETGTTKYYGYLTKTGNWYIMQNDTTANTFRYAKGTPQYTTAWTNRATLTYGYFNTVFNNS